MGERSLSMESGHFARNITIILIYGNTNSVNVDYNKISWKGWKDRESCYQETLWLKEYSGFGWAYRFSKLTLLISSVFHDSRFSIKWCNRKTLFVAKFWLDGFDVIEIPETQEKRSSCSCRWELHNLQSANNRIWYLNVSRDLLQEHGLRLSRSNLPRSGLAYLDWNRWCKMK